MLGLAFFISGDPNIGTGFELQAIAAAVIGGTPLRGGSATVVGAVLGAILLSAVNSGLAYFDVPVNWSSFATGAVILTAVALDSLIRGRRRARPPGPRPVTRRSRSSTHGGGMTVLADLIMARRRRTVALGAAVLALGAAGCGSDDEGGGGGGGAKEAKLAFVYPTTTTNFAQEMALGAKAAADATPGVKLTESAPAEVNGPKQVQLFQAAARSSKDGVAMMTLTPDLFIRPLQQAGSQNVPLVAVDVPPPKGTEKDVKLLIGNSNEEIGQDLAKALLPKIPEGAKGEMMIGTDTPGLPVLEQRNKGFMERSSRSARALKYIVFDAKQSPTDNFNTWSAQVKAHPDALAYVGPGSQAAVSLSRIQRRGGKKLVVGACDLDPVALEGVRDGYVTALISPEHWLKGYLAIKLMAAAKQDGKDLPEGVWNSGALTVNVEEHRRDHHAPEGRREPRRSTSRPRSTKQLANPDQYLGEAG